MDLPIVYDLNEIKQAGIYHVDSKSTSPNPSGICLFVITDDSYYRIISNLEGEIILNQKCRAVDTKWFDIQERNF